MNTEQERADFETWYSNKFVVDCPELMFIYYENCNQYQRPDVDYMWAAYQAGRAATKVREALEEALEIADKYNEFATYDAIKAMIDQRGER